MCAEEVAQPQVPTQQNHNLRQNVCGSNVANTLPKDPAPYVEGLTITESGTRTKFRCKE